MPTRFDWPVYQWYSCDCTTTSATQTVVYPYWPLTAGSSMFAENQVWTYTTQLPLFQRDELAAVERVRFNREQERILERGAAQIAAYEREHATANNRAEVLLLSCLNEEQQRSYKEHKFFDVSGKQRRYRIHLGRTANIAVIDNVGREIHRLCVHPTMAVPDCDTMLSQKILLEHDETRLLALANIHPARN